MNWDAIASIATFAAVFVALLPQFTNLFLKNKRKISIYFKLKLIIEDLMFLVHTTDSEEIDFLNKFHTEIDSILTYSINDLSLNSIDKIINLLFIIRIYDKSDESYLDLVRYVEDAQFFFADKVKNKKNIKRDELKSVFQEKI